MHLRVPKGFRDILPRHEMLRQQSLQRLIQSFRSYGYLPIDTPVLEYEETLLGKSGGDTEKQIYRFKDAGDRSLAMRFDLTVPFARFIATHIDTLHLPFRRYHIGKVFRGENTQKGRYREFMQCDFDLVGSTSIAADFEILSLAASAMKALHTGAIRIHLSHRGLFNAFFKKYAPQAPRIEILRTIDKFHKIGSDACFEILKSMLEGTSLDILRRIVESRGEAFAKELERIGFTDIAAYFLHMRRLAEDTHLADTIIFDPRIARGLDYYTGMVFECVLQGHEEIGSVCSGGRYDTLISHYTKRQLPCVGASIGIDRLLASGCINLEEKEKKVLIVNLDAQFLSHYHHIAHTLRIEDIAVEIFPDAVKFAKQFSYAEKKGIHFCIICGEKERSSGTVMLRDIEKKQSTGPHKIEHIVELLQ